MSDSLDDLVRQHIAPPPPAVETINADAPPPSDTPPAPQAAAEPMVRPRLVPEVKQDIDPRAAAFYKGLDAPISGTGQFLAKTGQAITSLGGMYPNGISSKLGNVATDIAKHRADVVKAATTLGGDTHGGYELAGEMGSAPSLALGAVKAPIMAVGALGGAMAPSADEGYWGNKAVDIPVGSLAAPVVGGAMSIASDVLAPKVAAAVQYLKKMGMEVDNLTIGQLLGGKVQAFENFLKDVVPASGIAAKQAAGQTEWRQAPVREALKKIGADLPEGLTTQEAIAHAQQTISDVYTNTVPNIQAVPLGIVTLRNGMPSYRQGFLGKIADIASDARDQMGDQVLIDTMKKVYQNKILPVLNIDKTTGVWNGVEPTGTKIHELTKDLNNLYNSYAGKGGSNDAFAEGISNLRKALQDKLRAADTTGMLAKADAAHSVLQIPQTATANAAGAGGEYSAANLMAAVKSDTSKRTLANGSVQKPVNYQGYAGEGNKVFEAPESSWIKKTAESAGAYLPAVAAGVMGHPLVAAGIAGAAIPITRAAYSAPVQGAMRWYADKPVGPLRQAAADVLQTLPRFGAGAMNPPLSYLRDTSRPSAPK